MSMQRTRSSAGGGRVGSGTASAGAGATLDPFGFAAAASCGSYPLRLFSSSCACARVRGKPSSTTPLYETGSAARIAHTTTPTRMSSGTAAPSLSSAAARAPSTRISLGEAAAAAFASAPSISSSVSGARDAAVMARWSCSCAEMTCSPYSLASCCAWMDLPPKGLPTSASLSSDRERSTVGRGGGGGAAAAMSSSTIRPVTAQPCSLSLSTSDSTISDVSAGRRTVPSARGSQSARAHR
mmetsp:Transcript_14825/g.31436  ORF Transcript_14825/g.31436 Transcript_14825/m.31436 type:complete len:240 (-) Transcript_14825:94-813(-)